MTVLSKIKRLFNMNLTFKAKLMALAYQGCASYCLHDSTEDFLGQTEEGGPTVYYCLISIVLERRKKEANYTL